MTATTKFKLLSKQTVAENGYLYKIEKGKSFERVAKIPNPVNPFRRKRFVKGLQ